VNEPGLCHGAAGLMHIFNRIYQATGQSVFRDAALRWLDDTLALCDFPAGNRWQESCGLLNGAAGIALALLAVVGDREPRWDRILLCDLRHP
jgi:lantibiotic biosynthesis protein